MKRIALLSTAFLLTILVFGQKSPRTQASGSIEGVMVNIDYGAPSVKGRQIWGGLEKYGKVWRAGANENTTVSFDKEVKIGGKSLAAGKYGFFIIPNENAEWTVIFNKKNDAWGAYSYKEADDALRVNVKPNFVSENQEQLKYEVGEDAILFAWEKARLSIPVGK